MATACPPVAADTAPTAAAVALPPRPARTDGLSAPVWPLNDSASSTTDVPLAAKCELDNHGRTVCCRDLKGADERHLINPDIVRDCIIGLADGLTVPFALTAGLSSLGSSRLVYIAGVAELVSGALSMGVGGYLSAQAERDHYRYLKKNTRERVLRSCAGEMEREVNAVLAPLGVVDNVSRRVAGALLTVEASLPPPEAPPSIARQCLNFVARRPRFTSSDPERLRPRLVKGEMTEEEEKGITAFLLKFGEGLEETTDARLFISAFTIGISYFVAGLVPLIPYFIIHTAREALFWSIGITGIILLVFGVFKTYFTGAAIGISGYTYGAVSTLLVGAFAAGMSYLIVSALERTGK